MTGATKADSWVDIEGGIGTVFSYTGIARRELNNDTFVVEGNVEPLSAKGTFVGQHILTSKEGVALHINAFNFPVWGMLEKIAPTPLVQFFQKDCLENLNAKKIQKPNNIISFRKVTIFHN